MTIAPCPKCDQPVTVPAAARPVSRVKCPLCHGEFAMSEVFEKLPPPLIVLEEASMENGARHAPATPSPLLEGGGYGSAGWPPLMTPMTIPVTADDDLPQLASDPEEQFEAAAASTETPAAPAMVGEDEEWFDFSTSESAASPAAEDAGMAPPDEEIFGEAAPAEEVPDEMAWSEEMFGPAEANEVPFEAAPEENLATDLADADPFAPGLGSADEDPFAAGLEQMNGAVPALGDDLTGGGDAMFAPAEEQEQQVDGEEDMFRMADAEPAAAAQAFDFGGEEETERPAGSKPGTKSRPAPKRKKKNMTWEMVKVIGGGGAGLLIAVVIIWHIKKDDPFKIAPLVPDSLSFIVPAEIRSKSKPAKPLEVDKDSQFAGNLDSNNKFTFGQSVAPPKSGSGNSSASKGNSGNKGKNSGGSSNNSARPSGQSNNNVASDDGFNFPGPSTTPSGFPGGEDNSDPLNVLPPSFTPPAVKPPMEELGVRGAPSFAAPDLAVELKDVPAALRTFEKSLDSSIPGPERISLAVEAYRTFRQLAEVVTYLDPNSNGSRDRMEEVVPVLAKLGATPLQLNVIGTLAGNTLAEENRSGNGILLAGTVLDIVPKGPLFETKVQLFSRTPKDVFVYSKLDPEKTYSPGAKVLVLGSIVDNPVDVLGGYTGQDMQLIWGGYAGVVPEGTSSPAPMPAPMPPPAAEPGTSTPASADSETPEPPPPASTDSAAPVEETESLPPPAPTAP